MRKSFKIVSAVSAALFFSTLSVQAAPMKSIDGMKSIDDQSIHSFYDYSDVPDTESLQYMKESVNTALEPHKERMQQAPKDVMDAFRYTLKAVVAIQNRDLPIAKESLDAATKLFNTALLDEPKLDLVAIADDVDTSALMASPQQIGEILRDVQDKLREHQTQTARAMLIPLVDQVTVTTEYLPMRMYPLAAKQALKQLEAGDSDKALETLQTAFSTIVTQEEVLPLPLIKADAYTQEASKLVKQHKQKALSLLNMAKRELKKAVLLGYAGKNDMDYKFLQKEIQSTQAIVKKGDKPYSIFHKIEKEFKKMLGKKENSLHQKV